MQCFVYKVRWDTLGSPKRNGKNSTNRMSGKFWKMPLYRAWDFMKNHALSPPWIYLDMCTILMHDGNCGSGQIFSLPCLPPFRFLCTGKAAHKDAICHPLRVCRTPVLTVCPQPGRNMAKQWWISSILNYYLSKVAFFQSFVFSIHFLFFKVCLPYFHIINNFNPTKYF